ncbi:MAG TPA: hypothetical protein VNH18_28875 [Bryobacteraceae bacterium]|nr:hypothetical protein [Bryobacteraceae bacterium]
MSAVAGNFRRIGGIFAILTAIAFFPGIAVNPAEASTSAAGGGAGEAHIYMAKPDTPSFSPAGRIEFGAVAIVVIVALL